MQDSMRPVARTSDVVTEDLDDEILAFDSRRNVACRLNRTAALVWRHADGTRDLAALVAVLRTELGELADEDLVLVTLDRLDDNGLIESGYHSRDAEQSRLSRRRFIRRVGVVGTAALALPIVQSVVAPTRAEAQSLCSGGCSSLCSSVSCSSLCSSTACG